MYYLRRLVVILKKTEYAGFFKNISAEIRACGMEIFILSEDGGYIIPDGAADGGRNTDIHENRGNGSDSILWITDSGAVAEYLSRNSYGVLAYLHNENRDCTFGGAVYAFEQPQELTVQYLDRIYRRYAGIPWDILDTARCHIRETTEQDIDAFYSIYSEPSITAHMENLYEDRDEEKAYIREYIEKIYGFYDFGVWTVVERESGQVIGRAGLSYREGFEDPELGFVIGVPWQRKGYAFEVCSAILDYGREELGFDKIQAFVEPENIPSLRLCGKLGFKKEGVITISGVDYCSLKLAAITD